MIYGEIERIRDMSNLEELNEKTIQTAVILPILRALDWNTSDPDEVILEYPALIGHVKGNVDIALLQANRSPLPPLVFIEAKAASIAFEKNSSVRNQIRDYCIYGNVSVGVLSNGVSWEFYFFDDIAINQRHSPPPPLPADVVNIMHDDVHEIAACFTKFLSRDSISDQSSHDKLKDALEQRYVQTVWRGLLEKGDKRIAGALRAELIKQNHLTLSNKKCQEYIRAQFEYLQSIQQVSQSTEPTYQTKPQGPIAPNEPKPASGQAKKPAYIIVFGKRRNVRTWKEVKTNFISALVEQHPHLLDGQLFELCAQKGKEYVVKRHDLGRRKFSTEGQVDELDVWTETHGGAIALENQCKKMLQLLGISQDEFQVVCED